MQVGSSQTFLNVPIVNCTLMLSTIDLLLIMSNGHVTILSSVSL